MKLWSSHCGTTGSSAGMPVLSPVRPGGLKDPAVLQLWHSSDLIPGPGTPYAVGSRKTKKIKIKMYT